MVVGAQVCSGAIGAWRLAIDVEGVEGAAVAGAASRAEGPIRTATTPDGADAASRGALSTGVLFEAPTGFVGPSGLAAAVVSKSPTGLSPTVESEVPTGLEDPSKLEAEEMLLLFGALSD